MVSDFKLRRDRIENKVKDEQTQKHNLLILQKILGTKIEQLELL